MSNLIINEISKYLSNLTATSPICDALGTTLVQAENCFTGFEPITNIATVVSILPYGGPPPMPEGDRQESSVQIRLKCRSVEKGLKTQQVLISNLHNNSKVCASANGRISADQSSPIALGFQEGGEYFLTVTNYTIKHTKL